MAKDVVIQGFSVRPVEDDQGNLVALNIQPTKRVARVSEVGSTLFTGQARSEGDPITVPVDKLPELLQKLANWPMYYAMGKPLERRGKLIDWRPDEDATPRSWLE